ncbi:helix-turn-helix domain-containing protein [Frigoribacterium sp. UYMn621]|uniref:helix-turn-helix transcriptional regulator n=1 Tax=Frigoribacterium sp. UYMn621 TaxID=3156343 RepID=UPI003393C90D
MTTTTSVTDVVSPGNSYAPLWSAEQIAEWGGLHIGTVRNWASTGRLPMPRRLGRAVRWDADDIIEWFSKDTEFKAAS